MLLLNWNVEDACSLGIGLNYKTLVLKGYISDEPLPIKNKAEIVLNNSEYKNFIGNVAITCNTNKDDYTDVRITTVTGVTNCSLNKDLLKNLNAFTACERIYVTIPIIPTKYAANRQLLISSLGSLNIKLSSLGIKSSNIRFIKYVPAKYTFYINGTPLTKDTICSNCPLQYKKVNGICWLEVDSVECLLNGYTDTRINKLEASLMAAANGRVIALVGMEDNPDDINSGGGLYYV